MSVATEAILAGVQAAGVQRESESDADWESRVTQKAIDVSVMLSERSRVRKAVDQIANSKVFPAVLQSVKREKSSTRGVVTLKTRPSKWAPDGIETARTERTDGPEGIAMAKRLTQLKGHRVLLWIEVEEYDGGKSRVVRHVQDLGEATDDDDE